MTENIPYDPMQDKLIKDISEVFKKRGVRRALVLLHDADGKHRVIGMVSEDMPETKHMICDYAKLIEKCRLASSALRNILDHFNQHTIQSLFKEAAIDNMPAKKAD